MGDLMIDVIKIEIYSMNIKPNFLAMN